MLVLESQPRFPRKMLAPIQIVMGMKEGCRLENGQSVLTPKDLQKPIKAFAQGGWVGLFLVMRSTVVKGCQRLLAVLFEEIGDGLSNSSFALLPNFKAGRAFALCSTRELRREKKHTFLSFIVGSGQALCVYRKPSWRDNLGIIKTRAILRAELAV